MIDINTEIFRRYSKDRKKEIVTNLTEDELLNLKKETVIKMIKKVGLKFYKSNKRITISRKYRAGNNWNSIIESFSACKNDVWLSVYIQYENTDTSDTLSWDKFFANINKDFSGYIIRNDRGGHSRAYYYTYDKSDKAGVMKSLLLEYVDSL